MKIGTVQATIGEGCMTIEEMQLMIGRAAFTVQRAARRLYNAQYIGTLGERCLSLLASAFNRDWKERKRNG